MTQDDKTKISNLLKSLWERNLSVLHARLDILDQAASAAASGRLTESVRAEALEIAHKFSGSLGMFGHHQATEIVRQIEQILDAPTPELSSRLIPLTTELRQTLLGESSPLN